MLVIFIFLFYIIILDYYLIYVRNASIQTQDQIVFVSDDNFLSLFVHIYSLIQLSLRQSDHGWWNKLNFYYSVISLINENLLQNQIIITCFCFAFNHDNWNGKSIRPGI